MQPAVSRSNVRLPRDPKGEERGLGHRRQEVWRTEDLCRALKERINTQRVIGIVRYSGFRSFWYQQELNMLLNFLDNSLVFAF